MVSVKVSKFEGPLDLLLHLIKKNKLNIYDINISVIVEQYFDYLRELDGADLEVASEFSVMAARLLRIKSRLLLPSRDDILEEQDDLEEDPRADLVRRLVEYRAFKEAAEELDKRQWAGDGLCFRDRAVFPDERREISGSVRQISGAFLRVIKNIEKRCPVGEKLFENIIYYKKRITIFSKVKNILQELKNNGKIYFNKYFDGSESRAEAVAGFLALLELLKLNRIEVSENWGTDGDLIIFESSQNFSEMAVEVGV